MNSMNIRDLLEFTVTNKASDLHLSAGLPPIVRKDGDLCRIETLLREQGDRQTVLPALSQEDVLRLVEQITNADQRALFEKNYEMDLSYEMEGLGRFRVNVFTQDRGAAAVFRVVPDRIPTIDELSLPGTLIQMSNYASGLVLLTGATGSGKSTTLAVMLDYINQNYPHHVITIEDPIEFVHKSNKCLINQRELHHHTISFSKALRSALREDPDVILVGELRDLETIRMALTAAETGHLVLATLHSSSASRAINRIIDVFPGDEKSLVRSMLSESLQAIVAQKLLKRVGGGRVAALEILISNPAIRNLIKEDKIAQIFSAIQTGQSQGMQTLDQHLLQLYKKNMIDKKSALEMATDKSLFIE